MAEYQYDEFVACPRPKTLAESVPPAGFEPATSGLEVWQSPFLTV